PQAVATMARSSRRRGAKMPGVSMNTSWAEPAMAMPRSSARVVCTLCVTIATLAPTRALTSVDFPTLGAPINATKPQRAGSPVCALSCPAVGGDRVLRTTLASQPAADVDLHPFAFQHGGGRGLLGGALGAAEPFRRRPVGQLDRHAELGAVLRAGARHLAIGRRRQAAPLCPFLQHGPGHAPRAPRGDHTLVP